jgi:hypothetical protein
MGRRGKATLVGAVDAVSVLEPFHRDALADGVTLAPDGTLTLPTDGEIHRHFKKECWQEVALWALRRTGQLDDVSRISLAGATSVTSLDALRGLERLEWLDASGCKDRLTSIEGVRGLPVLTSLNLSGSYGFPSFDALDGLPALETLNLSGCITPWSRVKELGRLTLRALRRLDLSHCYALTSLESLAALERVEALSLERCVRLETTAGIGALTHLRQLDLTRCDHLVRLEDLGRLRALEELSLHHCFALKNFDELAEIKSLRALDLCECGFGVDRWLQEVEDRDIWTIMSMLSGFKHLAELRRTCLAVEWDPHDGGVSPFH